MHILYTIQIILAWLLIVATILPFVKNDYWIFRILEYPRYQKLILVLTVLVSMLITNVYNTAYGKFPILLLGACACYLVYKIFPYTVLYKKEMINTEADDPSNQIKLFTANVYQDNKDYKAVLSQIRSADADVIFLLETNSAWEQEMDVLLQEYPNTLKAPLPNTYGLLFYSRLPIIEGSVKRLVEDDVPSIEAIIELPGKQQIKVFGLHPKPPVPGEDTKSTSKDKELMKVAFKIKEEKLPVIVMGDLNDVAWSYVTELFRKTSELLDPRRGRGFYSTFSANHWFMRFPLDYVFCSNHFTLIQMKRLSHNGSDHFPMLSHFKYAPKLKSLQEKPEADAEEIKDAATKATKPVN